MAETISTEVSVEHLGHSPYKALVAYPDPTTDAVDTRIRQLTELGITTIDFRGPLKIGKLSLLGKGVVGLVFSASSDGRHVAVKIRRVDSRRRNMIHEAEMLNAANGAGIGPELLGSSKDILEMEFVEGLTLPAWLAGLKGRGTRRRVRSTFRSLFEQCLRLDAYGIDHGELSRAHKNVLITPNDRPWILDYESASLMRRVNNFTSIAQYLYLSGRFSKRLTRIMGKVDREELVALLRLYKAGRTNDAYEGVAKMLRF